MVTVLYDAHAQRLPFARSTSSPHGGAYAGQANWKKEKVKVGVLASVWGVIGRAGVSLPTLGLRRRQHAYAYLKSLSTRGCLPNQPPGLPTYRHFLLSVANGLIILCLAGLTLIFYPVVQVELDYRFKKAGQKKLPIARAYFGDLLVSSSPGSENAFDPGSLLSAPDPEFSLVIPKIEAKAKIIANVDSTDQASYVQALKNGVAHAAGSSYPGKGGATWLFAHSTDTPFNIPRYNAVFYLLKELEPGDQVVVFYLGRRFNYQVFEKKILEADDTSFLENEDEERLVLQTCWPPGTTIKRLIVLAKPF